MGRFHRLMVALTGIKRDQHGRNCRVCKGNSVLIVQALYRLKSSGAAWHAHFPSSILHMGFSSSLADPDVWLRAANRVDGRPYYKYLLVYVDDIIIISKVAKEIIQQMRESYGFLLKDIGEQKSF